MCIERGAIARLQAQAPELEKRVADREKAVGAGAAIERAIRRIKERERK